MIEFLNVIVDFFRILLSPQIVIGAIVIVFFYQFKSDIQALLARIESAEFPGGKIATTQPPVKDKKQLSELPDPAFPKEGEIEDLKQLYRDERKRAFYWEYSHLNLFLVLNTQKILETMVSILSVYNLMALLPNSPRSASKRGK